MKSWKRKSEMSSLPHSGYNEAKICAEQPFQILWAHRSSLFQNSEAFKGEYSVLWFYLSGKEQYRLTSSTESKRREFPIIQLGRAQGERKIDNRLVWPCKPVLVWSNSLVSWCLSSYEQPRWPRTPECPLFFPGSVGKTMLLLITQSPHLILQTHNT